MGERVEMRPRRGDTQQQTQAVRDYLTEADQDYRVRSFPPILSDAIEIPLPDTIRGKTKLIQTFFLALACGLVARGGGRPGLQPAGIITASHACPPPSDRQHFPTPRTALVGSFRCFPSRCAPQNAQEPERHVVFVFFTPTPQQL